MSDAAFFVAGGTVPPGSPSYVERSADRELYEGLLAGEFCYVLNSRQMGKSSLAVRTIAKLNAAGVRTAFVDLTRLGAAGATPERWYAGLLVELGRALGMRERAMAAVKAEGTPAGRLFGFLADALDDERLVVFVDEVDATRTLPFAADDLFAGIRQAWNARATDPRYDRLTFCLMGAALPGDLVRDARLTPFNVGRRVELRDFSPEEARPFAPQIGDEALARVLRWTNGHPFLTQALCADLSGSPLPAGREGLGVRGNVVDALVRERYLNARAREADTNLADVGNRLLGKGDPDVAAEARADVLSLYERMLRGGDVADDEASPAAARVKMSGVARVEGGRLRVRNRIYREAFGPRWVRGNLPGQERRRQKTAFWKGALRAAAVGTAVAATIAGLAVNAELSRREAERLRQVAQAREVEAQDQTAEAERQRAAAVAARNAEKGANGKLRIALDEQRSLRRKAVAATKDAQNGRDEALRQKGLAQRSAAAERVQHDRAESSAKDAVRQRDAARYDAYLASIASLPALAEQNDLTVMREVVDALRDNPARGWEWAYWNREAHLESRRVRLDDGSYRQNPWAVSPDGRFAALLHGVDDYVTLTSLDGAAPPRRIVPPARCNATAFFDAGRGLLVSHERGLSAYDVTTGRRLWTLQSPGTDYRALQSLVFDRGDRLLCWNQGFLEVLDLRTRRATRIGKPPAATRPWLPSPDGKRLAVGEPSPNGWPDLVVYDVATWHETARLKAFYRYANAAWLPDARRLAAVRVDPSRPPGQDLRLCVFDARDGTLTRDYPARGVVRSVAVSDDGRRVAYANYLKRAYVHDLQDPSERPLATAPESYSVCLPGSGARLVSLNWDLCEFDVDRLRSPRWPAEGASEAPRIGPGGRIDLGAGTLEIYARTSAWARKGDLSDGCLSDAQATARLDYSKDGRRLRVVEASTGRTLLEVAASPDDAPHAYPAGAFDRSPDGRYVAFGVRNKAVDVYDLRTRRRVRSLPAPGQPVPIRFSPDGSRLAVGENDGHVSVVRTSDWSVEWRKQDGVYSEPMQIAFSPDGARLVASRWDERAVVLDARTGHRLGREMRNAEPATAVDWSPDGKRIVTGGFNGSVRLWDPATGRMVETLLSNSGSPIFAVRFVRGGRDLVSVTKNAEIRLWRSDSP